MLEIPRVAVRKQPSLDELVAGWLARRFPVSGQSPEGVSFLRGHPVAKERLSFAQRYAGSATGGCWVQLLDAGRPVAHLVDLIDAVHDHAISGGDVPRPAVWADVGFGVNMAWTTARAQAADDLSLCQFVHGWLDQYEVGLGVGRVRPLDLERVMSRLPQEEGTYALVLETVAPGPLLLGRTGALGRMDVRPGYYVYSGSACQSGGVRGRWQHHLTPATELDLKWQVDFLRLRCAAIEGWYTTEPFAPGLDRQAADDARSERECALAMSVLAMRGATVPVRGFGSPKRGCPAYLAHFDTKPSFRSFRTAVKRSAWPCRLQRVVFG